MYSPLILRPLFSFKNDLFGSLTSPSPHILDIFLLLSGRNESFVSKASLPREPKQTSKPKLESLPKDIWRSAKEKSFSCSILNETLCYICPPLPLNIGDKCVYSAVRSRSLLTHRLYWYWRMPALQQSSQIECKPPPLRRSKDDDVASFHRIPSALEISVLVNTAVWGEEEESYIRRTDQLVCLWENKYCRCINSAKAWWVSLSSRRCGRLSLVVQPLVVSGSLG